MTRSKITILARGTGYGTDFIKNFDENWNEAVRRLKKSRINLAAIKIVSREKG